MSELTAKQLTGQREALEELKQELEYLLDSTREDAKPVQLDQPIGRLTRMDAIQQQKMLESHRQRNQIRLRQVIAAFTALGNDTYGTCKRCEESIRWERLEARPETPICLECQEELEEE